MATEHDALFNAALPGAAAAVETAAARADAAHVLDMVADASRDEAPALQLAGGEQVRLSADRRSLELTSAQGALVVTICMVDGTPQLSFPQGRVQLAAPDELAVACRRFEVEAEDIALNASGRIAQVAGAAHTTSGREVSVKAERGDVTVEAPAGDVDVQGARILLNS